MGSFISDDSDFPHSHVFSSSISSTKFSCQIVVFEEAYSCLLRRCYQATQEELLHGSKCVHDSLKGPWCTSWFFLLCQNHIALLPGVFIPLWLCFHLCDSFHLLSLSLWTPAIHCATLWPFIQVVNQQFLTCVFNIWGHVNISQELSLVL